MVPEDAVEGFSIPLYEKHPYPRKQRRSRLMLAICFLIVSGFALYSYLHYRFNWGSAPDHLHHLDTCTEDRVSLRREWRHLTIDEQETYLEAVRCLQRTPGNVLKKQSLFGDFAYHHSRVGNICEYTIRLGARMRLLRDQHTIVLFFCRGIDFS